jgi:hypothetical protein
VSAEAPVDSALLVTLGIFCLESARALVVLSILL